MAFAFTTVHLPSRVNGRGASAATFRIPLSSFNVEVGEVLMAKVFADHSMSLDGFSTGPNARMDNPMGDGRESLHEWMFPGLPAAGLRGHPSPEVRGDEARRHDLQVRDRRVRSRRRGRPARPRTTATSSSSVARRSSSSSAAPDAAASCGFTSRTFCSVPERACSPVWTRPHSRTNGRV